MCCKFVLECHKFVIVKLACDVNVVCVKLGCHKFVCVKLAFDANVVCVKIVCVINLFV